MPIAASIRMLISANRSESATDSPRDSQKRETRARERERERERERHRNKNSYLFQRMRLCLTRASLATRIERLESGATGNRFALDACNTVNV